MLKLTVISPFAGYETGDTITAAPEVKAILDGENAAHVVKGEAPEVKDSSKSKEKE